jgi:hypothetical protein
MVRLFRGETACLLPSFEMAICAVELCCCHFINVLRGDYLQFFDHCLCGVDSFLSYDEIPVGGDYAKMNLTSRPDVWGDCQFVVIKLFYERTMPFCCIFYKVV